MNLVFSTDSRCQAFLLQVGDEGVYAANFISNKVEFIKLAKIHKFDFSHILMAVNYDFDGFMEPVNASVNPTGRAMHYELGQISVKGNKIILDYLDTSEGEILEHPHPGKVKEVYFSAEAPFKGEICDVGMKHAPFAEKTIAVKFIYGEEK